LIWNTGTAADRGTFREEQRRRMQMRAALTAQKAE
jgi:hypothetical protein